MCCLISERWETGVKFYQGLFDDNARVIKKLQRVVEDINGLEPRWRP
ncbi:hypothetical protein N752_00490 [Desulforamulus aquiferis]|nr:hypothetical protein N752_00490 [Desulforamulus aquiferis]